MKCKNCGAQNGNGDRYCVNCGRMLTVIGSSKYIYCPHCGAENIQDYELCINCGEKLIKHGLKQSFQKKQKGSLCPKCRKIDYSSDYCIRCGYKKKDVLGYYKVDRKGMITNQFFLEVNQKYIQIIDEVMLRYQITLRHIFRFQFAHLHYLEISSCRSRLISNPCLKFEFEGTPCKDKKPHNLKLICNDNIITIKLNKHQAAEIIEILPDELQEKMVIG